MAKIKLYSAPGCVYCIFAKNFLKENNISFEEIDISKSQTIAQNLVKETGQFGIPVIKIGSKVIIGFDKDKIKKALEE